MDKTIVKSVSYPRSMQKFLDENPELSLSKMVQAKIIEIMNNRKIYFEEIGRLKKQNKFLQEKILFLQEKLLQATDELEKCSKKR